MTAETLDNVFQMLASRSDVAHLLDTSEAPTVITWLTTIADRARTKPTGMWRVGIEYAPYAGSPDVVWLSPLGAPQNHATAAGPSAAASPANPLPSAPTISAWAHNDLHVEVMMDDLCNLAPEAAVSAARLRHLISDQGDICKPVAVLEAALGARRRSIKAWLMPGGALSKHFMLRQGGWEFRKDGVLYWRIDVLRKGPVYKVDAEGKDIVNSVGRKQLADKADRYASIPLQWLFHDPADTGGTLTSTSGGPQVWATIYKPTTLWAAMMQHLWNAGRDSAETSLTSLATMGGCHQSKMRAWWAAAEDQGLVSATGWRTGAKANTRHTHPNPLPKDKRTTETRIKPVKMRTVSTGLPEQMTDDEVPF